MAADDRSAGARRAGDRPSFARELWDAISPRTVALVTGVLVIQLLFIDSYVGAFHAPRPHGVPVEVAAPAPVASRLVAGLNSAPGHPVQATAVASRAAAAAVRTDRTAGALVVNPAGTTDTLLVASGGGAALASSVEQIAASAETAQHRRVQVDDLVPLQAGDYRGLTGFYLVVGWILGGYLVAALLGVASGARPATTRRAAIRLLAILPYAVLSGLGGALIVDQGLGALTGHFLALWGTGILLVSAAAATTLAFQVLAGVVGIGITLLVFVVAGNPSAGGAYQRALLPGFWRAISPAIPTGAGVDTVRRIVYFAGTGITGPLLVICGWLAGGAAIALLASLRHDRDAASAPRTS
jgi:hypothetical protein